MTSPNPPDFNLKEEAESQCHICKTSVPRELPFIQPMFVGDRYVDVCPKCALGVRNLLLGLPKTAKYPGDSANELYLQYISWLTQQEEI